MSKNSEKIPQEELDSLLDWKKKINKEEIFFESEKIKGLFFYEFKRNNERIFVLYKINDYQEENIYYNYFRFFRKNHEIC